MALGIGVLFLDGFDQGGNLPAGADQTPSQASAGPQNAAHQPPDSLVASRIRAEFLDRLRAEGIPFQDRSLDPQFRRLLADLEQLTDDRDHAVVAGGNCTRAVQQPHGYLQPNGLESLFCKGVLDNRKPDALRDQALADFAGGHRINAGEADNDQRRHAVKPLYQLLPNKFLYHFAHVVSVRSLRPPLAPMGSSSWTGKPS